MIDKDYMFEGAMSVQVLLGKETIWGEFRPTEGQEVQGDAKSLSNEHLWEFSFDTGFNCKSVWSGVNTASGGFCWKHS